jgi:hypothetical protein
VPGAGVLCVRGAVKPLVAATVPLAS